MSYDTSVYVGWYAQFDQYTQQVENGVEKIRSCPNSKKHFAKDKFCPSCGVEIVTTEKPVFASFPTALKLYRYGEDSSTSQKDIEQETFGLIQIKDLHQVTKNTSMIFPEFLNTDKIIIMAPGYTYLSDVRRSDSSVREISSMSPPSKEWIDLVERAFKAQNLEIKYGVAVEVQ